MVAMSTMSPEDRTDQDEPDRSAKKSGASEQPTHWSERAKAGLAPLPRSKVRVPGAAPGRSTRTGSAQRATSGGASQGGRPSKRNSTKKSLIILGCVIVAAAAVVAAIVLTRPDGADEQPPGRTTVAAATTFTEPAGADGPSSTGGQSGTTATGADAATSTAPGPSSTTTDSGSGSTDTALDQPPSTSPGSGASTSTTAGSLPEMLDFFDPVLGVSFNYPTSWEEISYDTVAGSFVVPTLGLAFGDPASGMIGTAPAAYIMFAAYEEPGQTAVSAGKALQEWETTIGGPATGPLTPVELAQDFTVNGLTGASRTYQTEAGGRSLLVRVCFLSRDDAMFIFVFRAEEASWGTYGPLFEAVLQSYEIPT
jgi:hypothetical protein